MSAVRIGWKRSCMQPLKPANELTFRLCPCGCSFAQSLKFYCKSFALIFACNHFIIINIVSHKQLDAKKQTRKKKSNLTNMPAFLIIWHLQTGIIYNNNNKELDLYSVNYIKRRTRSAEKTTTWRCIATISDKTFSIKHFFCGLPYPLVLGDDAPSPLIEKLQS